MPNKKYTIFQTLHPYVISFYFLICPIIMMCIRGIFALIITLLSAVIVSTFYFGAANVKSMLKMIIPVSLFIIIFNMLTNPRGSTLLFMLFDRRITFESIMMGVSNSLMLSAVMLWFSSMSAFLTNDKILYIFGKKFSKTAIMLSMIFREISDMKYKHGLINLGESETLGKMSLINRVKIRLHHLTVLLEWSMEDGIERGASMQARGYGQAKRTSYKKYKFSKLDMGIMCILLLLGVGGMAVTIMYNRGVKYFPKVQVENLQSAGTYLYLLGLLILMLIPLIVEGFFCVKDKSKQ